MKVAQYEVPGYFHSTEESGPLSEMTFPPAVFPESEKGILAKKQDSDSLQYRDNGQVMK
jgi:hypothetical protein